MSASSEKLHVYKSSAGSGKTTTLSIEYIKLALSYKDAFKHILALTFTNKAAQEMKDRILEYLEELIQFKDKAPFFLDEILTSVPKYQNIVNTKNESAAIQSLKNDAKNLYRRLLHHYSEYAVTTIDSFTNRLIRSFSHDLGLSFNYQVELETSQLLKDTVEELVNRIGPQEDLITQVLTAYSKSKIDSEKSRRIHADLQSRAKSLLNDVEEEFLKPLRELQLEDIREVQKTLKKEIKLFENQLKKLGQDFIQVCEQNGIEAQMFFQGKSSIVPYFNNFANEDFTKLVPNSYVLKIIEEGNWTPKTASQSTKNLIDSVASELLDIYQKTQEFLEENQSDYILMSEMQKNIFPYMVLMELEKILNQIKTENQLVHISDFNKIISEKIANESAPYIYERIGNKYQHYLLDEFQDTSVIQWNNLLPLVENSLSENNYNLIVGDAKQSIYRWRGGDVEQFTQLPKLPNPQNDLLTSQRENMLTHAYREIPLNTNYRSGKNIVDFNNSLFQFIVEKNWLPPSQQAVYQLHHQDITNANTKLSSVEIHLIELEKGIKADETKELYRKRTLEIIEQCIENGFDYKDIAILARKNKSLIELAEFLMEHQIPVVSSESLHVNSSPKVQFIISLLRHIQKPQETVYQVEIIRYLLENNLIEGENMSVFSEHLNQLNPSDELQKYWDLLSLSFIKTDILSLEAYEAMETICRIFKLDTKEPLLHFFLEASFVFTQEKHQDLNGFLTWWLLHEQDFKLEVPENWNAVKLMSIHKSKGLQFPVVINWFSQVEFVKSGAIADSIWINPSLKNIPEITSFPFAISSLENTVHHDIFLREKDLEHLDLINMFYVALTRPKVKLFLLVDDKPESKSESKSFRFDLLVKNFIQENNLKEKETGIFQWGEDFQKENQLEENSEEEMLMMESMENSDWRKEIKFAIDREKNKELNSSAVWGQKAHAVLAEINSENDIEMVLQKMIYRGILDQEERDILEETVLQVVQHPKISKYYLSGIPVYNEHELIREDQNISRPDRMVILENEGIIIDYKTGQALEKDQKQVQNYMSLVTKFTQKPCKGFLVYLHEEIKVEEVINN